MVPDDAIIQSWVTQPLYALPETQSGTMTYLVNRYAAAETVIQLTKTRTGFEGSLASHGAPVADAHILATEIDDGTLNITRTASLTNTVPPGSVAALVGLRINVECKCDSPVNVLLGQARYVDKRSNASTLRDIIPANQRVVLSAQQTMIKNSSTFPVITGDVFSFSIPMQAAYGSEGGGYVAVIFLNAARKEITRMELPFQPGQRLIPGVRTDKNGRFSVDIPAGATPPSIAVLDFPGSENLRPSSVTMNGQNRSTASERQ